MKAYIKYLSKKLMETVLLSGLKAFFSFVFTTILSIYSIKQLIDYGQADFTTKKWVFLLPYFIIILIFVIMIIVFIFRYGAISRLQWNYIFGLNKHTLCYIDKQNLEYTKTVDIIPLTSINSADFEYCWTGDKIKEVSVAKKGSIDAAVSIDQDPDGNNINKGKLLLKFNSFLPKLRSQCYDVTFLLDNKSENMLCNLTVYIHRPTRKAHVEVVTCSGVEITNVEANIYNDIGDRKDSIKEIPLFSKKTGNHIHAQTCYKLDIRHPKLFSRYEITWVIV